MKKILTFVLFILAISGCGLSADGKKINFQEYIETPGTLSCSIYYQNTFDPVSEIYRYRYDNNSFPKKESGLYSQYGGSVISVDMLNLMVEAFELKSIDELFLKYGAPLVSHDLYGKDYILFDGWSSNEPVWTLFVLQDKKNIPINKITTDEFFIKTEFNENILLIFSDKRIYSVNLLNDRYYVIEYSFFSPEIDKRFEYIESNLRDYKILGSSKWQLVNCFNLDKSTEMFSDFASYIFKTPDVDGDVKIAQDTICISYFFTDYGLISLNYDYAGMYLYKYNQEGGFIERNILQMPVDNDNIIPSISMPAYFENDKMTMLLSTTSFENSYIVSVNTDDSAVENFVKITLPQNNIIIGFEID